MLIPLVLLLAVLWLLTIVQPGGLDFLRVTAFRVAEQPIKLVDVLTGLVIVALIVTLRGPLAVAASALLVLWALTLLGIPRVQGIPLSPLIVFVIVVGVTVHIVTYRRR